MNSKLEQELRDLQNNINRISAVNMYLAPTQLSRLSLLNIWDNEERFIFASDHGADTNNEVSIKVNRKHKVVFNFKN